MPTVAGIFHDLVRHELSSTFYMEKRGVSMMKIPLILATLLMAACNAQNLNDHQPPELYRSDCESVPKPAWCGKASTTDWDVVGSE